VRDFFDRLTARALGDESMVSPRLPSLFEQGRVSPALPLAEDAKEVVATHGAMSGRRVTAGAHEDRASPIRSSLEEPVVAPATAANPRRDMGHESFHGAPTVRSEPTARDERPDSRPRDPVISHERPVDPVAMLREPLPPPPAAKLRATTDEGSLLAPTRTVFRTPPAPPDATQGRFQSTQNGQGMSPAPTPEPVVHVSIGRLEVRAAPAPAKTSSRHDAPRPSPLDDYLRRRDKASP
jgi:hypothetical protein